MLQHKKKGDIIYMRKEKTQLGKILEERKITLQKASDLTGIPFGSIIVLAYTQKDFKEIKVDTLVKLCVGLNIKAIDLFTNDNDKERVMRLSRKSRRKTM